MTRAYPGHGLGLRGVHLFTSVVRPGGCRGNSVVLGRNSVYGYLFCVRGKFVERRCLGRSGSIVRRLTYRGSII